LKKAEMGNKKAREHNIENEQRHSKGEFIMTVDPPGERALAEGREQLEKKS